MHFKPNLESIYLRIPLVISFFWWVIRHFYPAECLMRNKWNCNMVPPVSKSQVGSMLVNKLEKSTRWFEGFPWQIETDIAAPSLKKHWLVFYFFLMDIPVLAKPICRRCVSGEKFIWIIAPLQWTILSCIVVLKRRDISNNSYYFQCLLQLWNQTRTHWK